MFIDLNLKGFQVLSNKFGGDGDNLLTKGTFRLRLDLDMITGEFYGD
jgi:hypothetical protein